MSIDLTTKYLGMTLKSPLVVSSCPLTGDLEILRRLEEAGAAAAVLPSLFEEQIEHEEDGAVGFGENGKRLAASAKYISDLKEYNTGPRRYPELVQEAKQIASIPIIGSLNGTADDNWIGYAKLIEQAGADALELNIYFVPTDQATQSGDVERQYIELVTEVRHSISIPLAVKIGPYFSSLPDFAWQLQRAGADGLVLFNRFLEPDIDLDTLTIKPDLVLSSRHEVRLPLRWIAILRDQLTASLAATSGVHFAEDVVKALLVGADVVMIASVLMRYGPDCLLKLNSGLRQWLEEHDFNSVDQLRGRLSYHNCPDPSTLERVHYTKALAGFTDKDELNRTIASYRVHRDE